MAEDGVLRRLAAILAADVVGYSRLMSDDEAGTLARLKVIRRELFEPKTKHYRGRIFKTTGDGALVEFKSAIDAVNSAVDVQRMLAEHEASIAEDRRIRLRIGISLGDVIVEGSDLYGNGVNVAARMESLAEPGGICISGNVYEQVRGAVGLGFDDLGEQKIKNITNPVHAYRVHPGSSGVTEPDRQQVGASPPLPEKPSIVVLPLANLSGDPSQDYFADGMVEDITIALGRLPWLFVIGSASAFTYKTRAVDLRQIGSELGVRYALTGSVRKESNRVRIAVQLTDTSRGGHVWADRFEGELDSVFAMQDRVASQVSSIIAPALRSEEIERARHKPTESLTAYDLFLRALPLYRDSLAHNREALLLLQRAIELDPSYGAAYGLAAICYFWQRVRGWVSPLDASLMEGVRFAHLAAQTGANDPEALWMAAQALTMLAGELETGSGWVAKALALNPNSSNAWAVSAVIHGHLGDLDTSLDHFESARRLNPLEFPFVSRWAAISHAHFVAGDFEEVIRCADRSLAEHPHALPAMRMKIAACGLLGRIEEGRECAARLQAAVPTTTVASLKAHYEPLMRHRPGLTENFVTGLRRTGLPEN